MKSGIASKVSWTTMLDLRSGNVRSKGTINDNTDMTGKRRKREKESGNEKQSKD